MGQNRREIIINYQTCNSLDDLPKLWQTLIKQTLENISETYAPYSKFSVSSGILLNNDQMYYGGNVENAVFPIGICAERNVLSYVMTNKKKEQIEAISIYGQHQLHPKSQIVSPCGMCRQAILEAEAKQNSPISVILISNPNHIIIFNTAKDLLPFAFDKSSF